MSQFLTDTQNYLLSQQ